MRSSRTIGVLPIRATRSSATSIGSPASVTRWVGTSVDGDVVVGVEHHRQAPLVELLGDGRRLGARAEHADAPRDVAAQVGDQREQRLAGGDVHACAAPGPRAGVGGVASPTTTSRSTARRYRRGAWPRSP